ncbi:LysR family transcriptional regulator [Cupriavidus necator]|uniref:LysR family transcriptional regulator n=1 Tax=Cupriavidus necator TaxID=106590 RepID=UPI001E58C68F|nr:LysR family transcriptional regulator [Cupriavidus necator]
MSPFTIGCPGSQPTFLLEMKLHQLRALVAIADSGSIRNAARATSHSPAAITKAVRELEDEVGVTLIIRETTGITLTQAGQVLLEHARLTVGVLARARQEMDVFAGKRKGTLAVGIPAWLGMTLLGEIAGRFQLQMPDTRLEFFESLLTVTVPKLRDGTLDLSIGRMYLPQSEEFAQLPLFSTGYAVVARAGHPLAECRTLQDLKGATWILNRDFAGESDGVVESAFSDYCSRYAPRIHISHSSVIATNLIASTDFLSLMPWPLAELLLAKDGLCVLPIRDALPDARISITHRRAVPLGAAAKCFIDATMAVIRESANSTDPAKRRFFRAIECLLDDGESK